MILITGGLGFLGANLTKLLCDNGERVLVTSNRNVQVPSFLAPYQDKTLKIVPLDITSLENVSQAIRQFGVRSIVHAAVRSEKDDTPLYLAMHVNVTGTVNVLEAARIAEIKRVVFISSEAVYQGMKTDRPYKEEEQLPITSDRFIPGTKKAGEILSLMYCKEYGMEVISARATRMYGPLYQGVRNLAGHMVDNAAKGKPIALANQDPAEAHDVLYAKDAARAVMLLLKTPTPRHRIYNVGFGRLVSLSEFAAAIKKSLPKTEIHLGDGPGPLTSTKTPMDINECVDISRLTEETGFKPEYDAYRGVEHYIRWAREGSYS
jgi:nucleoside-diphosphate-sugar epimerase